MSSSYQQLHLGCFERFVTKFDKDKVLGFYSEVSVSGGCTVKIFVFTALVSGLFPSKFIVRLLVLQVPNYCDPLA